MLYGILKRKYVILGLATIISLCHARIHHKSRKGGLYTSPMTDAWVSDDDYAWFDPVKNDEAVLDDIRKYRNKINVKNEEGYTGLDFAVLNGRIRLVKGFLQAGADPNAQVESTDVQGGMTSLHLAIQNVRRTNSTVRRDDDGSVAIVKLLLDNGADPTIPNYEGDTPLHIVLNIGNFDQRLKVIRFLLQNNASFNVQNQEGFTPMHIWVNVRDKRIIREVLLRYASMIDLGIKDNNGRTPARYAEYLGYVGDDSVLTYLTYPSYSIIGEKPMQANEKNFLGQSALSLAAMRNDKDFAKKLRRRGSNPNVKDIFGRTELYYALFGRDPVWWVGYLLEQGSDPNNRDKHGKSVFDYVGQMSDSNARGQVYDLLKKLKV